MLKTYIKVLPLVLLITTGFYKPITLNLPIDITLLVAVLTTAIVIFEFVKHNFMFNKAVLLVLFMFLIVLPTVRFGSFNEYSKDKTIYWYTLTLLSAIAPMLIIKTQDELRHFYKAIIVILSLHSLYALANLITHRNLTRLESVSDTIALGRASGMLVLLVLILILQRKVKYSIGIPLICVLTFLDISSGSKGPILFTFIVAAIVFTVFKWRHRTFHSMAIIFSIIILVAFLNLSSSLMPQASFDRVMQFLNGEVSTSLNTRITLYTNSIESIKNNAFGIGFGNAQNVINKNISDGITYTYPHNIILEIFLECGWLIGLLFITFWGFSIFHAYKKAKLNENFMFTFTVLLFLFLNAIVSGEINDRMLFAFVGLALSFKPNMLNTQ
ncbi:MAG: O-antigen ligase family protein [Caulobacteraceae bacterium]